MTKKIKLCRTIFINIPNFEDIPVFASHNFDFPYITYNNTSSKYIIFNQ